MKHAAGAAHAAHLYCQRAHKRSHDGPREGPADTRLHSNHGARGAIDPGDPHRSGHMTFVVALCCLRCSSLTFQAYEWLR